jgi:predicted dehydrogenase
MNRRSFLRSGLGLAALATLSRHLPAAESRPSGKPRIKIGFLGAAHSHAMEKVKVIRESPDFDLVGICEESPQIRAPYAGLGVQFLAPDELFRATAVVAIESAVGDHAPHARLALDAGKHVHVEKPPADSLAACRELVDLARQKKRLLQTGYMWRYNPGFVVALEAARQGWLGDVYLVRGTMNTLLAPNRRPEWARFKGGAMFELGCHLIDPMVRLLGRPKAVTPFLKKHGDFADTLADNTTAVFEFEKAMGMITNATLQPNAFAHRSFEILGTNGTALLKPIEPPTLHVDLARSAGPYAAGNSRVNLPPYRRYVGDFEELAAAVRGERPLGVSLDEELLVQETLMRACQR